MIKLVASDLDGTILLNGAQHVDDSMCETIDMLGRKGIIFAPASGRQCESLVRLFSKVKSPLMYSSVFGIIYAVFSPDNSTSQFGTEIIMTVKC